MSDVISTPQSVADMLDSLLDTGVIADAQLVISVAGVDLIHVGLRALLASADTAARIVGTAL
jgi:gas vesicle structural protein